MRDLPPGSPHAEDVIEPFVTLASLIHMISRPHLGVSTLVLTRRNAIIVAKQTTALDLLSQGRLILGVVGHREEEFAFLGADYAHRGAITDKPIVLLLDPWRETRFLPRPEGLAAPRGPGRGPRGRRWWSASHRSRCPSGNAWDEGPAYFAPVALRHVLPAEDHALWARLAEPTERALVRRPGLRLL